jgi:hypothetical protein
MSAERPRRLAGRLTPDVLLPDLGRSIDNLLLHKLRTLLTMLGMIFGVAAVLSMLSIGAGAQQQVMAFIEGLGVRNVIVEARETTDRQAYQKIRLQSPGLTFQDMRAVKVAVRPSPRESDSRPPRSFRNQPASCRSSTALNRRMSGSHRCNWRRADSSTTTRPAAQRPSVCLAKRRAPDCSAPPIRSDSS